MSTRFKRGLWISAVALGVLLLGYVLLSGDDGDKPKNRLAANSSNVASQGPGGVAAEEIRKPSDDPAQPKEEPAEPPVEEFESVFGEIGDDIPWNAGGENEPTVEDVQQWTWLRDDLNRLIDNTRPKSRRRVEPEEFKKRYMTASLEYLQLDREELDQFETAVKSSLKTIVEARAIMQTDQSKIRYDEEDTNSITAWRKTQKTFLEQQEKAAEAIVASLPERRRTTLMREQALRWIVRYDFGIQHASRAPSR